MTAAEEGTALTVHGRRYTATFDKATGLMTSLVLQGRQLLAGGPAPNFWRAPTDNDYGSGEQLRAGPWRDASRNRVLESFLARSVPGGAMQVESRWRLPAASSSADLTLTFQPDGTIHVRSRLTPAPGVLLPDIPRVGLSLTLPRSFGKVEWFGRGPHENYWDRRTGAALGRYQADVSALPFAYERPQETGSRVDNRWLVLSNERDGTGLLVVGLPTVDFSAWPFTNDDLDGGPRKTQRHTIDVPERDLVTLNLDFRQSGLGGDTSWGALAHRPYRIPAAPIEHQMLLRPIGRADGRVEAVARDAWRAARASGGMFGDRSLALETFDGRNRKGHLAHGRQVNVSTPVVATYSSAGAAGLVDGVQGSVDYRGGDWLASSGPEFVAVVDLGAPTAIREIEVGFLAREASGLRRPQHFDAFTSSDGVRFVPAAPPAAAALDHPEPKRVVFTSRAAADGVRYVKIRATVDPPARLAVDEITVR